jgi:hypothetical protein
VYPAPAVTALIRDNLRTVRIHIKEQPTMWKRFDIRWTPTILILGPDGHEARRIEGFLPADEFMGQIRLGLAFVFANKKDWKSAQRWFEEAARESANTDAGPEALYWAGVAKYSDSHNAEALKETSRRFATQYQGSSWAKRASVWAA